MNASQRAAQLRAQADSLDSIGELEQAAAEAKTAYRQNPTAQNREAHRAAAAALNGARALTRDDDMVISTGADEEG